MRENAKRSVAWLFRSQEIVRSDATFDVPPIFYPFWYVIDIIFGGPPRLLKRMSDRRARSKNMQVE